MNRLDKIKQEFLEQFQSKLSEEGVDLSIESAFDILISADPSRNKKNVRWLMETYLDDGYLWEDISNGKHSKVYDTLNTFIRNKNKLDILDRSINRYESVADMWKMVKQYAEDKTGKEIKREEYDRAMAESEIVIDNDDMRIVVPLTEYASKFHGRGTRWCTAADNNIMFWRYAEESPLFIITLKESGDKLQLWTSGDDVQFMDADDADVSIDYIEKKWNLLKDIVKYTGALRFIPPEQITPELCEIAVQQNGLALNSIPSQFKTYDLCKLAVQQDSDALGYVPNEIKTPEICEMAVKQKGKCIQLVPLKYRTHDMYKIAVKQNGLALSFIPVHLITPELCKIACKQNGLALRWIPPEQITPELCEIAVKQNGLALKYIPSTTSEGVLLKTPELYKLACQRDGYALYFAPKHLITPELCKLAVEQNGMTLKYVPDMTPEGVLLKTPELCRLAVKQYGMALEYVPNMTSDGTLLKTPELYRLAVQQNVDALSFVPAKYITPELCKIACERNGEALAYIPHKLKTPELLKIAVKQNKNAFDYIPKELITPELLEFGRIQKQNMNVVPMDIYQQKIEILQKLLNKQQDSIMTYR